MTENQQTVVGGEHADIGARLSKTFSLYSANFLPFLLIALVALPLNLLSAFWEYGYLLSIPGIFVGEFVAAALVLATWQSLNDRAPDPGDNLSAALDKLGRLIEYLLRTIGAVVGLAITIVGIPWAIRVGVRWFFGVQAIMLQDLSAKEAISESCRLVEKNWWRSFGNLLLVGLIVGVASSIGFGIRMAGSPIVGGGVSASVSVITTPFFVIAYTLLYLRLMQEKGPPSEAPSVLR